MTVNGKIANNAARREALQLWRKILTDPHISRHVTIEYREKLIRVGFDSVEEQVGFLKELLSD